MLDSIAPIGLVAVKLAKHIKNLWLIIKTGPDIAVMHAYGCVPNNHCTSVVRVKLAKTLGRKTRLL